MGRGSQGKKIAVFHPSRDEDESKASLEHSIQALESMSLRNRRFQFIQNGYPRHFYKYRTLPAVGDSDSWNRLADIVVRGQLWMAHASTLNDPFDSHIEYRVSKRGAELRKDIVEFYRRTGKVCTARASAMVDSDLVASPEKLNAMLRASHAKFLDQLGICSLSADPRSNLLWSQYAGDHHGICIQIDPAVDPRGLIAHQMIYTEQDNVVFDPLTIVDRQATLNQLLSKGNEWRHEKEWRLIEMGATNVPRQFQPQAVTGLVLGVRCNDPRAIAKLEGLLDQRSARGFPRPIVYQAEMRKDGRRFAIWRRRP